MVVGTGNDDFIESYIYVHKSRIRERRRQICPVSKSLDG